MKQIYFGKMAKLAILGAIAIFGVMSRPAVADSFTASYLGVGVQTPTGITNNYETFDGLSYNGTSLTTSFNGSSITGTYTGALRIEGAGEFGGAGGKGSYIAVPNGDSYTLSLSSGVNYFGLWFSALDKGNHLQFYSGDTLKYSFSPTDYTELVGFARRRVPGRTTAATRTRTS